MRRALRKLLVVSVVVVAALARNVAPVSAAVSGPADHTVAGRVLDAPFISDPPSGTLLRFVEAYAGSSSSEVRVVIVNASDQTLDHVAFGPGRPHTPDFVLVEANGCGRAAFAPGDTCILYYRFQPLTVPGHPLTDYVDIFLGNQTFSYTLTGSALYPLDFSPAELDYGGVPLGLAVNRIVTFTNISPVTIRPAGLILDIPADSPFSSGFGQIPNSLAPGASFDATLQFQPRAVGSVSTPIGMSMYGHPITVIATGCGVMAGQICPKATPTPTGGHGSPGHSGGSPHPGDGTGSGGTGSPTALGSPAPTVGATVAGLPGPEPSGSVIAAVGDRPASGIPLGFTLLWAAVVLVLALATVLAWRWKWVLAKLGRR